MILVTGAAGKTGRAVVEALSERSQPVRALVRRADQVQELNALGAHEAQAADLLDAVALQAAFAGVRACYHICPNMHPDEVEIGQLVLEQAGEAGVDHFLLHSVLHPQTQAMAHHWNKLLVEEHLINSGLPFTILQPASYMQNLLGEWGRVTREGRYRVPYSLEAKFSPVDLLDVAEAAAVSVSGHDHVGAIYELAGPEVHTPISMAAEMGAAIGRDVQAEAVDSRDWAARTNLDPQRAENLRRMFDYYSLHGLWGNPRTLAGLLGRSPGTLGEFLARLVRDPAKA